MSDYTAETSLQMSAQGCLLGLAVGDALGTTLEFSARDSYQHLIDMVGGGPFQLKAGQWTDDTSMALCLGESLFACNGFDPKDQLKRYIQWMDYGHNSSTGICFDIGYTTQSALENFKNNPDNDYPGGTSERSAGNGSLMRLAPIPLFYGPGKYSDPSQAILYGGLSSKTTHSEIRCIDSCRFFACLVYHAIATSLPKIDLLKKALSDIPKPLHGEVESIARRSWLNKERDAISSSGYVINSLEAALWCFWNTDNFRDGALLAANLGDDADTVAAIYGQIGGAYYGITSIPKGWLAKLYMQDRIAQLALQLIR